MGVTLIIEGRDLPRGGIFRVKRGTIFLGGRSIEERDLSRGEICRGERFVEGRDLFRRGICLGNLFVWSEVSSQGYHFESTRGNEDFFSGSLDSIYSRNQPGKMSCNVTSDGSADHSTDALPRLPNPNKDYNFRSEPSSADAV